MKVVVNWSLCEGNGNCAAIAPELFALDDDDILHVPHGELRRGASRESGGGGALMSQECAETDRLE